MLQVSALYIGISALVLMGLSLRISLMRLRGNVSIGDGGDPRLASAIRLQANFTEYAPMVLLLILALELQGAPGWMLHGFGAAFLIGRGMHAVGYTRRPPQMFLRKWGMVVTYCLLLGAGTANIAYAFGWHG